MKGDSSVSNTNLQKEKKGHAMSDYQKGLRVVSQNMMLTLVWMRAEFLLGTKFGKVRLPLEPGICLFAVIWVYPNSQVLKLVLC
ncbi:hypothetical protein CK203_020527 [Vitis vinifera]|uniref:Uncharacterized protein n=1 Tax=Vitis vinifera TaxID=29760 RepID=A0A438FMI4_VITVI|nr:hypothetical protein CK203_020527 [Vitis vinifera]